MCCGSSSDPGPGASAPLAQLAQRADPDAVYMVTYFNGVTEEVEGLAGAQQLLINPAARVEGARTEADFPRGVVLGGTYTLKE